MDGLDRYRETLTNILNNYAAIPYAYGEINNIVIVSENRDRFLLINEGWEGKKHIHHCLVHAEIRDDKIWIHYDGIEEGTSSCDR